MASSSSNEKGIDTRLFQSQLPDMLLCKICNLVPKYPVKIETCSHIFCKGCFHPHRTLAVKNSQPLICPVDEKVVEFHNVVYEEQTEIFIGNQGVYCPNKSRGCQWEGPYKCMDEHLKTCEKKDDMREVLERLTKMEKKQAEKDREINFLKNNNEVHLSHDIRNKLRKQKDEHEALQLKVYELTRATEDEVENLKGRITQQEEEIAALKSSKEAVVTGELKEEVDDLKSQMTHVKQDIPIRKPPKVYIEFTSNNKTLGRIIIELYFHDGPKTCQKFNDLITNEPGWGYKGAKIDWVEPLIFSVAWGVLDNAKSRGHPTDEYETPTENLSTKSNKKGLVTMWIDGGKTKTRFFILSQPCPPHDGKTVVIGHVTDESWCVAEKVWEVPRDGTQPRKQITISDCGVVN